VGGSIGSRRRRRVRVLRYALERPPAPQTPNTLGAAVRLRYRSPHQKLLEQRLVRAARVCAGLLRPNLDLGEARLMRVRVKRRRCRQLSRRRQVAGQKAILQQRLQMQLHFQKAGRI
jgi:hypothetical protein